MTKEIDKSLGDEKTRAGKQRAEGGEDTGKSLGDSRTQLGGLGEELAGLEEELELVDLAARYEIERPIGQGGMGEVLLATDRRLKRKVAIKRVRGELARNKAALGRFLTEARAVAALAHNNIVQLYDYGRDAQGPFMVMEYVDGGSLLEKCRGGALRLEEAVELTCQLCDGLARAHDAGIIHRDIKPANILLTKDGTAKLTDFGLAKAELIDVSLTMTGAVLGTLDFMPPEQRRDVTQTDARSDLWSLAATLYQMVTGNSPKVIQIKKVPVQLQNLLDKGLEEPRENRFQSARDFKQALKETALPSRPLPDRLSAELVSGECPGCYTGNESHRKYCRECGESLRCDCLKCAHQIPLWDKVCPECGGRQAELAAKLVAELGQKRERAERLRSDFEFDAAIVLSKEVAEVNDRRTSVHLKWAVKFAESTGEEKKRQLDSACMQLEEAKKHRGAFDYKAAIQAIEAIPQPLRSKDANAYREKLESEIRESNELLESIETRIHNRDLDELLPLVEKALNLRGDRDSLRFLAEHLRAWEQKQTCEHNEAFVRAERLLFEGNAGEALKMVKVVGPKRLMPTQKILLSKLENIVAERTLREMVQQAKADGVVDAADIVLLLPKALDCTRLFPNNRKFLKLKEDLLARTVRVPVELLRTLPKECIPQLPLEVQESMRVLINSIGMRLKPLSAGMFMMGEPYRPNATPHQVTLTRPFHLSVFQVTQEQYERVMGWNPSRFKSASKPVEQVSWLDAIEFCRKLSALTEEKAAGREYRLPTEAEWEYACRAGSTTKFSFGDDESQLGKHAWFEKNSGEQTHPVGEKRPNAWGLYDMHGNVWEWCADWYGGYPEEAVVDPIGASDGPHRVIRGGSWCTSSTESAGRDGLYPSGRDDVGFRVALSFPEVSRQAVSCSTRESSATHSSAIVSATVLGAHSQADLTPYGPKLSYTVRTNSLNILQAEVAGCSCCPELVRSRRQTVFGVGNPQARLCFLGESPGQDEDAKGEPFVGAAGQLLDKIIMACSLRREDVFILNTLKCRPPWNRTPSDSEVEQCWHFTHRQLEIIQPEFICCLGSVAAKSLLRTGRSIALLRGGFHRYRGSQVVVTYHPAYLLRMPSAKRHVWEDMKMLMNAMGILL
jgi:DNA polymerase